MYGRYESQTENCKNQSRAESSRVKLQSGHYKSSYSEYTTRSPAVTRMADRTAHSRRSEQNVNIQGQLARRNWPRGITTATDNRKWNHRRFGPELAISGSRSLSKSFGYTFIEFVVIENPEFVVGISTLSVIVSEILVLPVIWPPSSISGTHRCPMTSAVPLLKSVSPKM